MRARAPGRPGDSNGESAGRADQLECRHQCAASFGEPRRSRGERARTHRLVRGTLPLPAAAAAAVFCPLRGPLVADAAAAVCCLVAHAGASTWSKWAKLVKLSAVSLRRLVPQPGQSGRNWSNCLLSRCARLCAGPSLPLRLSSIFCAGLYVFLRLRLSCASMSCPGSAPAGTRSDSSLNWSKWAKPAPPFQTGQNKQPKSPTSAPAAHRFRAGRKAARGRPDRLSVAYWSHQLSESSVRASYPSPSLLSEPPIRVSYPSRPSESFGGGGR